LLTLPPQLLESLASVASFDKERFVAAHNQAAQTSVRRHSIKGPHLFADNKQVAWCPEGIYLPERPVFTLDPLYHAGCYYVQEASSMFLAHVWRHLIAGKTGQRVLDLCAAPGGKSTLLASLLDSESLLISNDVIRSRATILEENMTRWGYMNTWVSCNDPKDVGKLEGYFDVIVTDVPCSGSGLFRKDAAAMDEWSEENVALCSGRQQRILADIWPALKEGGILIYATCSFSRQENEDVLDHLKSEYDITTLSIPLQPDWGIIEVTSDKGMTGYRFFPDKVMGEGFFIAALQKNEYASGMRPVKFKPQHHVKALEYAQGILDTPLQCVQTENGYRAIYPGHEEDLQLLQKMVYFRKAGIEIGSPTAKEWVPAHDVALSTTLHNHPALQVTRDQALLFLKKEDMRLENAPKGWQVIEFNNHGLGWVKSLGNRVNNYLPKHWRIRMEIPDLDRE